MGRISNDDWSTAAWKAAAETHGRKNAGFYTALHYAPHVGVAILLGLLGGAGYWLYDHVRQAFSGGGFHPGVPSGVWLAAIVLAVGTVVAYRPGRLPTTIGPTFARAAIVTGSWLLWFGFLIAQL
jgi:hypothetical protein